MLVNKPVRPKLDTMWKNIKKIEFKTKIYFFVFLFSQITFSTTLNADFTTRPAAIGGVITICNGQTIVFTNNSANTSPTTIYDWQFPGGTTTSASIPGPHSVTYLNAGTYTASLTVDNSSNFSVTIIVNNGIPSVPSLSLIDGNFWTAGVYNGENYFTFCSNNASTSGGLFSFTTASTQTDAATLHIFDWGDSSPVETFTGNNLGDTFHFYANAGNYSLTYTVILSSGCISERIYNLYVGAVPTATIVAVGIPTSCDGGSITYNLVTGAQNTPSTIYTFQVNDGSPPRVFTHPPPTTITHQFLQSSCGTTSNINNAVFPNSYQASVTISNACGISTNAVGPINIESSPIADFSRTPSNDIVCEGTTVAISDTTLGGYNIGGPPNYICTQTYRKYWTITGPLGLLVTTSGGALVTNPYVSCAENFGFNNNQPNNPGAWLPSASSVLNATFMLAGDYTITFYTGSNTCGITSETQTICVAPQLISDFTMTSSAVCAPTVVTLSNTSSSPACSNTNNYLWEVTPTNPDNCPTFNPSDWVFSNGDSSSIAPEITINSPGIYTIGLTTSLNIPAAGALCAPITENKILIVKGRPVTTLSTETICEGSTITLNPTVFNCYANDPVVYDWDFGTTPPASISSITDPSPFITFNAPGVYNYILTVSNECGSNTYNSSITVLAEVQLSAIVPLATCVNTSIQLTSSITGGATGGTWTASITGGTFTPSATNLNPTYTPPLDYIGSISFTITSDAPSAPCVVVSDTFTTIFNTEATVAAGTYDPLCENGTLTLNGNVGGAASSAVWSTTSGGTFSDPTDLNSTYSPPNNFIGDVTLTLTTNDPSGPCNAVAENVIITILPTPTVNPITDLLVCDGTVISSIIFSGANANLFTWTNSNTAIGLADTGTGDLNFTASNTSTGPITSTITVTPVNNVSSTFCPGTATSFTITVNPRVQINSITNQTACNGTIVGPISFSTTNMVGTTTYEWTNDTPSIGIGTNGTGDITGFTATNTTLAPLIATFTVTPTFTYNGVICIGIATTFTIIVNPNAQVNTISDLTYCNNNLSSLIAFTSNITGGINTYTWTNDNISIGLNASGTGDISSFPAINNSTTPVIANITVTPFFTNNGVMCSGSTETFTITVNPSGQIDPINSQTICTGSATNLIVFNTTNLLGTTTYEWTNTTPSIGIAANGIGNINAFTASNTSLNPIVASILVTPTFTYNGISCIGTAAQFTITVNPSAQVNTTADLTFCNATNTTPIVFTTNTTIGNTQYNWTNDNTTIGLNASGTGNINSFLAVNTSTIPIIANITVTPFFTNNGVTCNGQAETFQITVNPSGQVNSIVNQSVCNGTSTTAIVFSTNNSVGTTTYNWTNSNSTIGLAASGTGNINAFTANNNTLNPIITTITVTPSFTHHGISCSGTTAQFTITVNPSPVVFFSVSNQSICSEESSTAVQLTSTTSNVTFNWSAIAPSGVTGVITTGSNNIPVQNLINTTNAPITITYNAFAIINDATGCQGFESTYSITVLPKPSISDENLLLCSEQTLNFSPNNGVPNSSTIVPLGTNYTWTISNNPSITGASNGSGTSISQTLTNLSAIEQVISYTVIPTAAGCIGTTFTLTITVLPKPDVLFDESNQVICNNSATLPVTLSSTITGLYAYTWSAAIPAGIVGAQQNGTDTIPIQTLLNTTTAPLTITYTAFATFQNLGSSCTGPVSTYEITVNPTLIISSVVSNYNGFNISAFGRNDGFINLTVSGGSSNYTFNWIGPNGFNAITEDINNLIAGDYSVTITDGICATITLNFTLIEPDELLVQNDLASFQNINCYGDTTGQLGIFVTQESVRPFNYELISNAVVVQSILNSTNLNPIFTGLIAGSYTVRITDANGVIRNLNTVITEPTEIIVTTTSTPITCFGADDASITLSISGGLAPYVINWSNLASGTFQDNLEPGTYNITITDALGCIKNVQVIINNLPIFNIQPIVTQISCNGAANGRINLGLIGGQAPIVVIWNDGSAAGLIRNNLSQGIYTATVSDSGSACSFTRTFNIIEPQVLSLNGIVQNDLNCNTSNNGSVNLIVTGGTPPYSFNWSNGTTNEDLSGVSNGTFSVLVTDSRGCIANGQYSVFRPANLVITLIEQKIVDCITGQIINVFEAKVNGGVPPYQINWSNGTVSGNNNEFMTTNQNGLITVTVTDSNSCNNTSSYIINNPIIGNANFSQTSFGMNTYGEYSIGDPIQFTNLTTGDYIGISWDFGDGIFSTEENPTHTYLTEGNYQVTLLITYDFGCTRVRTILLTVTKGYKLMIPNGFTANNDVINDNFGPVSEGLTNLKLSVYDTWGSLVYYEEGNSLAGWNGNIKGVPAENGNYYYKISGITFYNKTIEKNGPFILLK
jgi:gliding motility-associated-like protein